MKYLPVAGAYICQYYYRIEYEQAMFEVLYLYVVSPLWYESFIPVVTALHGYLGPLRSG